MEHKQRAFDVPRPTMREAWTNPSAESAPTAATSSSRCDSATRWSETPEATGSRYDADVARERDQDSRSRAIVDNLLGGGAPKSGEGRGTLGLSLPAPSTWRSS